MHVSKINKGACKRKTRVSYKTITIVLNTVKTFNRKIIVLSLKYLLHLDGLRCFGEFPLLERYPRNNKRHGDVCRTMYTKNWRCPKGCFKVKRGKSPFCKMWRKNKSTVCRVERGMLTIKRMIFYIS